MSWTLPRIYTLGNTPLLSQITHQLSRHPNQPTIPEIVKLFSNETEFTQFRNANSTSILNTYNNKGIKSSQSIQLMSAYQPPMYGNGDVVHIKNMIIDGGRLKELSKYKKCLTNSSNILLLNGDKAIMDHLLSTVFRDDAERPNIYQSICDFKVWNDKIKFNSNLFGFGGMKISKIPKNFESEKEIEQVELLKLIGECNGLNAKFLKYQEFKHLQYELLIVKSTISTFTTLFDCTNGELLKMKLSVPIQKYVNECVKIILASDSKLNIESSSLTSGIFDINRLINLIYQILKTTESQSSLMRIQFKAFDNMELFNNSSYFCKLARDHKIKFCLYNTLYNQLLNAKIGGFKKK